MIFSGFMPLILWRDAEVCPVNATTAAGLSCSAVSAFGVGCAGLICGGEVGGFSALILSRSSDRKRGIKRRSSTMAHDKTTEAGRSGYKPIISHVRSFIIAKTALRVHAGVPCERRRSSRGSVGWRREGKWPQSELLAQSRGRLVRTFPLLIFRSEFHFRLVVLWGLAYCNKYSLKEFACVQRGLTQFNQWGLKRGFSTTRKWTATQSSATKQRKTSQSWT